MVAGRKSQIVKEAIYLEQRRWVVTQEVIIYLEHGEIPIEVTCSEQNKMGSTGRSVIPYQTCV